MGIEKLRHWHWMILALLAGFLIGSVQNAMRPDFKPPGMQDLSQTWLEDYVMRADTVLRDGKPVPKYYVDNFVVERRPDPRQQARRVSTVEPKGNVASVMLIAHGLKNGEEVKLSGADQSEYNGRFKVQNVTPDTFDIPLPFKSKSRGTGPIYCETRPRLVYFVFCDKRRVVNQERPDQAEWRPHLLDGGETFKPKGKLPKTATYQPGRLQRLAEKLRLKDPDPPGSVLDYLASIQASTNGVNSFEYRWWIQPRFNIAAWMLGCFVVIGMIWPTLINIMLYGSIFAPPREKSASLRKVKSKAAADKKKGMTQADMDELKRLDEELEAKLMKDAKPRDPNAQPEPVAAAAAPIRQLTGTAEETQAMASMTAEERHAYMARADDFYPVERPAVKKKDEGEE